MTRSGYRWATLFLSPALLYCASANAQQGPTGDKLISLSRSLEGLSQKVAPAVVEIQSFGYRAVRGPSGRTMIERARSGGSGVLLSADGYIVTNAHVIAGAKRIEVAVAPVDARLWKGSILRPSIKSVPAKVIGIDSETDIAVIKIAGTKHPHLELADSEKLRNGQMVLAFGSPFGLEGSVSMGVVSAVARQLRNEDRVVYIQTDAPINPGNSGGPLVNAQAEVVGINTFILSKSGGSHGVGFAVPGNIVRAVYEQLRGEGRVQRGIIGARAQTITPLLAAGLKLNRSFGVILSDIYPNSPALKAGLKSGDVVVALDGKLMENGRQFDVNVYQKKVGTEVELDVIRHGKSLTVKVPVAERPDHLYQIGRNLDLEKNSVERLGIVGADIVGPITKMVPGLRRKTGVLVVLSATLLGDADTLMPGDAIHAINENQVRSLEELRTQLANVKSGDAAVITLERRSEFRYLTFEME